MTKISAIIPAAGSGSRFGELKQFKDLAGQPLIFYSINLFIKCPIIDEVVVVVQEKYVKPIYHDILSISAGKPIKSIAGGLNRQDSVQNGVLATDSENTLVCIHDAARPFVTEDLIITSVSTCEKYDGAIVALPSLDTVKLSEGEKIKETLTVKKFGLHKHLKLFKRPN